MNYIAFFIAFATVLSLGGLLLYTIERQRVRRIRARCASTIERYEKFTTSLTKNHWAYVDVLNEELDNALYKIRDLRKGKDMRIERGLVIESPHVAKATGIAQPIQHAGIKPGLVVGNAPVEKSVSNAIVKLSVDANDEYDNADEVQYEVQIVGNQLRIDATFTTESVLNDEEAIKEAICEDIHDDWEVYDNIVIVGGKLLGVEENGNGDYLVRVSVEYTV